MPKPKFDPSKPFSPNKPKFDPTQAFQPAESPQQAPAPFSGAENAIRPIRSAVEAHTMGLTSPVFNHATGLANWLGGGMKGDYTDKVKEESERQKQFESQHPVVSGLTKTVGAITPSPLNIGSKVVGGIGKLAEGLAPEAEGLMGYLRGVGKAGVQGAGVAGATQATQEAGDVASNNEKPGIASRIGSATETGGALGAGISALAQPASAVAQNVGTHMAGMTPRMGQVYKENPEEVEGLSKLIFGNKTTQPNPLAAKEMVKNRYMQARGGVDEQIANVTSARDKLLAGGGNVKVPASALEETGFNDIDDRTKSLKAMLGTPKPKQVNLQVPVEEALPSDPVSKFNYQSKTLVNTPSTAPLAKGDSGITQSWEDLQKKMAFPDQESSIGTPREPWKEQPFPRSQTQTQNASVELPPEAPSHYNISPKAAADLNQQMNLKNKFNTFDPAGNKAVEDAGLADKSVALRKGLVGFLGDRGQQFEEHQGKLSKLYDARNAADKSFLNQPFKAASTAGVDKAAIGQSIDKLNDELSQQSTDYQDLPNLSDLRDKLGGALTMGKDRFRHIFHLPLPTGQTGRALIRGSRNIDELPLQGVGPLSKKKSPED